MQRAGGATTASSWPASRRSLAVVVSRGRVGRWSASPSDSGFRHKVAFVFASSGTSGSRLVMGHYQAHSRRVVPVQECPVHSDLGNRLAFALRDRLAASRVPPGVLRHVLVRTTTTIAKR